MLRVSENILLAELPGQTLCCLCLSHPPLPGVMRLYRKGGSLGPHQVRGPAARGDGV